MVAAGSGEGGSSIAVDPFVQLADGPYTDAFKAIDAEIASLRASMPPKTLVEPESKPVVSSEVRFGLVPEPPVRPGFIKTAKRAQRLMKMTRLPDGQVVTKLTKAKKKKGKKPSNATATAAQDVGQNAGFESFYGGDPGYQPKKRAKKLGKPISERKRQKLVAKAATIADPVQRDAALSFIGKMPLAAKTGAVDLFVAKSAKAKLPAAVRAAAEADLTHPDPIKRDRAWMALHGIEEEKP